mgnify:CR=1 FL=1|jgi:hypothetical protein
MITQTKSKPNRITLTVSAELKQALDDLQNVSGVAASSFVGEIMENSIPMIRGITASISAANTDTAESLLLLDQSLTKAFQELKETQKIVRHKRKLRSFAREDSGQ